MSDIEDPINDPILPEIPESQREIIALWMQNQFYAIEQDHAARVEALRNAGEHPSPVFSSMVKRFGGLGLAKSLSAKLLGISNSTFNTHYLEDYELGSAEIISQVMANMLRVATSQTDPAASKVGMQILDRRGGEEWLPPAKRLEMSQKKNEVPIIDSSKLTYEERQQLRAMITRAANGGEGDPVGQDEDEPLIGEGE